MIWRRRKRELEKRVSELETELAEANGRAAGRYTAHDEADRQRRRAERAETVVNELGGLLWRTGAIARPPDGKWTGEHEAAA